MGTTSKKTVTIIHPETGEEIEVSPKTAEFAEVIDNITLALREVTQILREAVARLDEPKC